VPCEKGSFTWACFAKGTHWALPLSHTMRLPGSRHAFAFGRRTLRPPRPACLLPSAVPRPWVEERQRRIGEPLSMTNTPKRPTRHHLWCSDRADMCLHPACGTRIGPYVTAKSAQSGSDPSLPFAPHGCSSYVRSTHAAAPAMLRSRRQVFEPHSYRGHQPMPTRV
jgi:hypothetical protein